MHLIACRCIFSAVPLPRHGQRTSEACLVEPQLHEHEPYLLPGYVIREQVLASTDKLFRGANHLEETNSVFAAAPGLRCLQMKTSVSTQDGSVLQAASFDKQIKLFQALLLFLKMRAITTGCQYGEILS